MTDKEFTLYLHFHERGQTIDKIWIENAEDELGTGEVVMSRSDFENAIIDYERKIKEWEKMN